MLRQAKGSFVPAKESKPVRKGSSGSPPEAHPSKRQKTGMSLMKMDLLALSGMGRTIAVLMISCLLPSMIFGPGDSGALTMSL